MLDKVKIVSSNYIVKHKKEENMSNKVELRKE